MACRCVPRRNRARRRSTGRQNENSDKSKTQQKLKSLKGGAHSKTWVGQWQLSDKSKKGGWIVQTVVNLDAAGKETRPQFWEAWEVKPNSQYTKCSLTRKTTHFRVQYKPISCENLSHVFLHHPSYGTSPLDRRVRSQPSPCMVSVRVIFS